MNFNKMSATTPTDARAAAFIARVQQCGSPSDDLTGVDGFKNLSPFEMKRLLDYFDAQYGCLARWSLQDVMETFAAECHKARVETNAHHSIDRATLHRAYADESATDEIITSYFSYYHGYEIDPEKATDDDPITRCHESDDFTLNVYP